MLAKYRPQGGWRHWMTCLPRYHKRAALVINDLAMLAFAVWASYSFRLNTFYVAPNATVALFLMTAPVIGVLMFHGFGLYKIVTRFIGPSGAQRILLATSLTAFVWTTVLWLYRLWDPSQNGNLIVPRFSVVLFAFVSGVLVWGSRQFAGWVLTASPELVALENSTIAKRVLIYGAGSTGVQLLSSLRRTPGYKAIGFIDERPTLHGQMVAGLKVFRPLRIGSLIGEHRIDEILVALPEASRSRRRSILRRLEVYKVGVKTLPGLADIASGRVGVSDLKAVSASDLLGRDRVRPDTALLRRSIVGKAVLVTGAGGSIGSELARQIYALNPKRLVLLDVSEPALFEIEQELKSAARRRKLGPDTDGLVTVLGSIHDEGLIRRTLQDSGIETVFHAAAYKHVPMVEHNPAVGIRNNTFGTRILADAARDQGVERFVLISTDKAVRPTNIMGASKRLAELYLQALAGDADSKTIFTMVRFGNVLDSSGSVVRLFRKQIENGGPVTVTHPDIIRYFMSIPEAAELVIQAGAMAHGGEVFVLDMGAAVKIDALARSMIKHVGLKVKDQTNPGGDIAIIYTGLRPGEKLYEELLINELTTITAHPRIRRSLEPGMSMDELERELASLNTALATADLDAIHAVLKRTVEGYVPDKRHLDVPAPTGAVQGATAARVLH
jgi:FlaA1/EpsC-like NDP-sugar epimerase